MTIRNGREYTVADVFWVLAIVLFVLAAFDVHISQFGPLNLAEFGLASYVVGALL